MDRPESDSSVRRYIAYISTLGTTQLYLRNPFVIAWWSLAFPGLGHLLLSKYLRGYLLLFGNFSLIRMHILTWQFYIPLQADPKWQKTFLI